MSGAGRPGPAAVDASGLSLAIVATRWHQEITDSLVTRPDWNIVVQKTGYIHEAGRCLVMQTVIEDRTVVIVLLNSFGKRTRVADARRVRRWVEATLVTHAAQTASTT